jgi:biotin carboxyl carrier protein
MKQYRIVIEGRTFDVRLQSDPRQSQVHVDVNGVPLVVDVEQVPDNGQDSSPVEALPAAAQPAAPAPAPGPLSTAGNRVLAPLPGLIKSVAVEPGQKVGTGEILLVIEAMKMDNVLRASRAGIVETIHAVEGRQVSYGDPLLEYRSSP